MGETNVLFSIGPLEVTGAVVTMWVIVAVLALVFLGLLNTPLSMLVNAMWNLMLRLTGFVELLWGY